MSRSTSTKQRDILSTQSNAEETHKSHSSNEQLSEMIRIEGTPFHIVKQNDKWFLVMGDYRVTEQYDTKEEAETQLEESKWLIILTMCAIVMKKGVIEVAEKQPETP